MKTEQLDMRIVGALNGTSLLWDAGSNEDTDAKISEKEQGVFTDEFTIAKACEKICEGIICEAICDAIGCDKICDGIICDGKICDGIVCEAVCEAIVCDEVVCSAICESICDGVCNGICNEIS